jgi:aspartyl-tRNA synthetase
MRRPELRDALVARARINGVLRDEMMRRGFVEIETPSLLRSTPEGARDYLVPSRVHPGTFYALLQSPQILKQLTMVGGLDRYWQIVRCFRDEDLRADRQPEFTQLDVEMSFVTAEDVQEVGEGLVHRLLLEVANVDVPRPFPRLSYDEALLRYGSDKPDLRFDLPVHDLTEALRTSAFAVFRGAVESGGVVRAIAVPAAHPMTRKEIDALPAVVLDRGAKGVAWCRIAGGEWSGTAAKHLTDVERAALIEITSVEDGGLLLFLAGARDVAVPAAGDLRNHLGRAFGLIRPGTFAPCWIVGFPLFERDAATGAFAPAHHAFTAPVVDDVPLLDSDPGAVRAQAYDLALNGLELLGGSIRIHSPELQEKVLNVIGMGHDEAHARFGFLLEGLRFGAPPHGGFAMGTDRLVALLLGLTQIRDVIAFPKTTSATDLMCEAPSAVAAEQLADLHILTQKAKA